MSLHGDLASNCDKKYNQSRNVDIRPTIENEVLVWCCTIGSCVVEEGLWHPNESGMASINDEMLRAYTSTSLTGQSQLGA